MVVLVALSLNVANVIGYTKCEKESAKRLSSQAGQYIGKQLFTHAMTAIRSTGTGAGAGMGLPFAST